jgi:uncharacterized protein YcsI (UPF0317 family)
LNEHFESAAQEVALPASVTGSLTFDEAKSLSPADLRKRIRAGDWTTETVGLALGQMQANLAIVPLEDAFDFMRFCQRNPKPCPLITVTDPGDPTSTFFAADADIRTDLPRYKVFRDGEVTAEPYDLLDDWQSDSVAFLLGCSLTFENALLEAGVPLRHLEHDRKIPVYITNVECEPAGKFAGPMVVSMRAVPAHLVSKAAQISARYPWGHGGPVHVGDPSALGIDDVDNVDFGEPPIVEPGDVPMFWGCGITPQLAARRAKPRYMMTHYPEHMLVSDRRAEQDAVC